jgi:molybdopterin converting factor small subunit
MNVRVRLSAGLAPAVGSSRLSVTLAETATVADLLEQLRAQYPPLALTMTTALPIVSGRPVALSDRLTDDQEVALLLPAAGGSR